MKIETKIKKAIELYMDKSVEAIEVLEDPQVKGTYAVRTEHMENIVLHWLIVRIDNNYSVKQISNLLEEVEFGVWPPISGRLKFF